MIYPLVWGFPLQSVWPSLTALGYEDTLYYFDENMLAGVTEDTTLVLLRYIWVTVIDETGVELTFLMLRGLLLRDLLDMLVAFGYDLELYQNFAVTDDWWLDIPIEEDQLFVLSLIEPDEPEESPATSQEPQEPDTPEEPQ
jgi:hypothetical protein